MKNIIYLSFTSVFLLLANADFSKAQSNNSYQNQRNYPANSYYSQNSQQGSYVYYADIIVSSYDQKKSQGDYTSDYLYSNSRAENQNRRRPNSYGSVKNNVKPNMQKRVDPSQRRYNDDYMIYHYY